MYSYYILLQLSDVQPDDAKKYQDVMGFGTGDIFSCLLLTNRKSSLGPFAECHVTGVTKRRINTYVQDELET